jgi:hypothetical protein
VSPDADYGNVWKPPDRQTQGQFPYWVLQPDLNGGGEVLGTGEHATIAFSVTGIVTTLPPGVTLAYLSYANVPGYNDGFFALEIVKVEPIVLRRFEGTFASQGPYRTGPVDVQLTFDIANATYVTIVGTDYARRTTSADFADTVHVSLTQSAAFTLLAYNNKTGQQIARPLNVQLPTPPVVIDAFFPTAPGLAIPPNQSAQSFATLEMRVQNATSLVIPGTGFSKRIDQQPFHGYAEVPLRASTTYTLIAVNEATGQHAFASCHVNVVPDPLRTKAFTGLVRVQSDGTPTPISQPYGWDVSRGDGEFVYDVSFGPGTFNGTDQPLFIMMPVSYPGRFGSAVVYQAARPADGSVTFAVGLQADQAQKMPVGFYFLAFQPEAYAPEQ